MRTTSRRAVGVIAAAAALSLAAAGTASAHDCINVSRSAQGNASAGANSQAWYTVVIADAIAGEVEEGLYSEAQGVCVLAYWTSHGGPASFTTHVKGANGNDGVLAGKNKNTELTTDGKGIDQFGASYGALIGTSYATCGVELPEDEH